MGKIKVVLTQSAYQDLDKITDFLLEKRPSAALKIYNELMDAYKNLEKFPLMGIVMQEAPLRNENYRKLIAGEYVTIYRFIADTCVIDHVFHGKENYGAYFASTNE